MSRKVKTAVSAVVKEEAAPAADAALAWVLVAGSPLLESMEQCRVSGTKNLPVLDGVKITVKDHQITLNTTNLEKHTIRRFGCGAGELAVLADWKTVYDWLQAVVSADTVINLANDAGSLIAIATDDGGKTTNRARFKAMPFDEFPIIADASTPLLSFDILKADLRYIVKAGNELAIIPDGDRLHVMCYDGSLRHTTIETAGVKNLPSPVFVNASQVRGLKGAGKWVTVDVYADRVGLHGMMITAIQSTVPVDRWLASMQQSAITTRIEIDAAELSPMLKHGGKTDWLTILPGKGSVTLELTDRDGQPIETAKPAKVKAASVSGTAIFEAPVKYLAGVLKGLKRVVLEFDGAKLQVSEVPA